MWQQIVFWSKSRTGWMVRTNRFIAAQHDPWICGGVSIIVGGVYRAGQLEAGWLVVKNQLSIIVQDTLCYPPSIGQLVNYCSRHTLWLWGGGVRGLDVNYKFAFVRDSASRCHRVGCHTDLATTNHTALQLWTDVLSYFNTLPCIYKTAAENMQDIDACQLVMLISIGRWLQCGVEL